MIVTITPNPSVDRTMSINDLERGSVVRSLDTAQVDPGGKGINVARALTAAGVDCQAVVPVGGLEGDQLVQMLRERGIEPVVVPIAGSVRVNITLTEPDGTTTKLNEQGPTLSDHEVVALLQTAQDHLDDASWLVGSGSLAPGAGDDFWGRLITLAHAVGARTAIDTSGIPLKAAIDAQPDLVKPNSEELADAVGVTLTTLGDAVRAARELVRRGARTVLASLGEDGAILVDDQACLFATAPAVKPVSSVGAGDSLLAGYLAAIAQDHPDRAQALRMAVAYGTAAVQLPGSTLPAPTDLRPDLVTVHTKPDLDLVLRG